jgi:cob(I)alamin adenosyltransferase
MIQAYIGDGKGKSTAGLGLAVRAHGAGLRVCLVLFDKGSETYRHHEENVLATLGIPCHVTGVERMTPDRRFRFGVTEPDRVEARRGLELARSALGGGTYDLVVLDEFLSAVSYGLLAPEDLRSLLEGVPAEVELVLTGRCGDESWLDRVDLITRMTNVRHYFAKGLAARPGIEY